MKTPIMKNLVILLWGGLIIVTLAQLSHSVNAQSGIKAYLPIVQCQGCAASVGTPTPTVTTVNTSTPTVTVTSTPTSRAFTLSSSAVAQGGALPTDYVCDGYGGTNATLPLTWSGAPTSTQNFALTMYTIPGPGETHWYWVLYNIPPTVTNLPKNVTGIGTLGNNFKGTVGYTAPCSQGSGLKFYTYTLYALAAAPVLTVPPAQVSRDVLLAAISDRTLATAELNVTYNFPVTGTATPTPNPTGTVTPGSVILPGATPVKLVDSFGFQFTEGPAADSSGNVYFSDVVANRIYKWSLNGQITLFRENSGGANGLFFDSKGNLLACEGGNKRLVSIDLQNNVTVLTSTHKSLSFNQPNDLWLDAKGGVYFSDPVYSGATLVQAGEYVYYLTPKRDNLVPVIMDMVKPNGLIGSADGQSLYVTDPGANITYRYKVAENGNLSDKTVFVAVGGDGMTIDAVGNVYLAATNGVLIYNASGALLQTISLAEQPTNVTFGGAERQTLFITARTAVYTLAMQVKGGSTNTPATPTPTPTSGPKQNISQAISDEAQRNTIAFDALAFMTGDMCADTFLPPGKVADFSGFQFLRDNDPTNMGHNTDFVTIIAYNILNILTPTQTQLFLNKAQTQIDMINQYGYGRFPLIKAFRRQIGHDWPTGSTGLDKSAVMSYSAALYKIDGQISYDRAELFGTLLRSLTETQRAKIEALKAKNGIGNWDTTLTDPLKDQHLSPEISVAVMTYASEFYSWYAGSLEGDTYFCPERQGTYFGSFYMKDMPAMNNPDFTIPDTLTADMGRDFLATLTLTQQQLITNLVNVQRTALYGIVDTREDIALQLRKFITGTETVDKAAVLALAEQYGREDGEIVYDYAVTFAQVYQSLTPDQKAQLLALRQSWNNMTCSGAYLYSAPLQSMPVISNTDFLFAP